MLYVKHKEQEYKSIKAINNFWINKRMILPSDLASFNRDKVIKEAREVNAKSSMLWNIIFDIVLYLHKRLVEI